MDNPQDLSPIVEIDAAQFAELRLVPSTLVIDVREEHELPRLTGISHRVIPMSTIYPQLRTIESENVILVCQHGVRSMYAAELLHEELPHLKGIYSLKGGVAKLASELA
jgi:rhodanese-related sulfurtransferase